MVPVTEYSRVYKSNLSRNCIALVESKNGFFAEAQLQKRSVFRNRRLCEELSHTIMGRCDD